MCLRNGWWCWTSGSYPAGKYQDITITTLEMPSLRKCLKVKDRILVDKAWSSEEMKKANYFIVGHRKPRGQELDLWKTKENEVLGHFRGVIENHFGK